MVGLDGLEGGGSQQGWTKQKLIYCYVSAFKLLQQSFNKREDA